MRPSARAAGRIEVPSHGPCITHGCSVRPHVTGASGRQRHRPERCNPALFPSRHRGGICSSTCGHNRASPILHGPRVPVPYIFSPVSCASRGPWTSSLELPGPTRAICLVGASTVARHARPRGFRGANARRITATQHHGNTRPSDSDGWVVLCRGMGHEGHNCRKRADGASKTGAGDCSGAAEAAGRRRGGAFRNQGAQSSRVCGRVRARCAVRGADAGRARRTSCSSRGARTRGWSSSRSPRRGTRGPSSSRCAAADTATPTSSPTLPRSAAPDAPRAGALAPLP